MKNKTILDWRKEIDEKNLRANQIYDECVIKLNKISTYNASLRTADLIEHNINSESILNKIPYSLKDNIVTKDIITTGGSLFLEEYKPKHNSTVKNILDQNNALLISKDNLDEFGLGGTGTFSGYGHVINPLDSTRITGGSSSGSAVMVQQNIVPFALGTDTGDSIRKPASFLGIVGYKPTYGTISRFGVYPYAPTLDHVGILANNVTDVSIVLSALAFKDKKDFSSIETKNNEFYKNIKPSKNYSLAVLTDVLEEMNKPEREIFDKYLQKLSKEGFKISYIEFSKDLLSIIDPIYKALSYGEATTCYASFSGITFGKNIEQSNFVETMKYNRTNFFGKQLKRRFVIGAYITSTENIKDMYFKSKKIRTLIINRTNEIFDKYDAMIIPGASSIAPLVEDVINNKPTCTICDDAIQIGNFAGLPSITIPAIKYNDLPVGINITCQLKEDLKLLNIALAIEGIK